MNNRTIIKSAKRFLVGGVDSPVRSFAQTGGEPIPIKKGRGSRIYDYEGNSYIDYVLSYGVSILGHSNPGVVKSLNKSIRHGFTFGATCAKEVELARIIKTAIPFIGKVRFVNSGTEAVMGAVALARGYTRKDKILKCSDAYHGHAAHLFSDTGSEYGDYKSIEAIFKKQGNKIAGIIVEPAGGNYGVIRPDREFLKKLRRITREYNSLLIFDEVITAFRFSYGSLAAILGVKPDIISLGKIIGGGLPVGAFAGPKKVMDKLSPIGDIYLGSTFAGNPLTMASGAAALNKLALLKDSYSRLTDAATDICETIKEEAGSTGIEVSNYKGMFSLKFEKKGDFTHFHKRSLSEGIYFAPSENEANFISFSHTKKDIELTKRALRYVFRSWRKV